MEYEEAPSGFVKLYNYKEPFMKFEGGFGYQGVLLFDGESDKIQCHFCGNWFDSLGHHLQKEHNMYASEYKETVGLFKTTALINEKVREKLIASGQQRFKNLKNRKGTTVSAEVKARISKTLKENVSNRERQNTLGTCPAQLISKLQAEYQRLGYTPIKPGHANYCSPSIRKETKESAKRLGSEETYNNVFGSWKNALAMANIPYRTPGQTLIKRPPEWNKEKVIKWATSFIDGYGHEPKIKDIPKHLQRFFQPSYKNYLNKKEIFKLAFAASKNTKGTTGERYTPEQLIKFLQNFNEVHGRQPSYSDSKRGLIPHLSRYSYHYGSWKKALKLSFPNK